MASEPGADVQLTDLEVIQQFSLAVRGATAPREQVIAALESDLAYLKGSTRAPAKKAPAKAPSAEPPGKAPAKKAPVKVATKAPTRAATRTATRTATKVKVAARTTAKKAATRR